ncbi:XRE family transcriptional regulator [Salmonirosea aquatica]
MQENLRFLRKANKLSLREVGELFGIQAAAVQKWEKGTSKPSIEQLALLSERYNVSLIDIVNENIVEDYPHKIKYPEDLEFIELPFVSVPARASFIEMPDGLKGNTHETYTVIKKGNGSFEGQICIEVNGDSMEPNYPSTTVVRCKQVDPNDWPYITSGVYVVVFANSFVIKRIRDNNYQEGFLTLHSDNTETGGKINVKTQDLRQIWKVLRIVDAPAR